MKHIFAKYCTPKPSPTQKKGELLEPPEGAYLAPEGLDAWARDTNGAPFDDATKEELLEFMDVTEDGGLTSALANSFAINQLTGSTGTRFKGFMQVYQLQTENDEEETWRDLVSITPGLPSMIF